MEIEPSSDLLRDRVALLPGWCQLNATSLQRVHGSEGFQERLEQLALLHPPLEHDEQLHSHLHYLLTRPRHLRHLVPVHFRRRIRACIARSRHQHVARDPAIVQTPHYYKGTGAD